MKQSAFFIGFMVICFHYACNYGAKTNPVSPSDEQTYYNLYLYATSLFGTKRDSAFYYFNHITTHATNRGLVASAYTYMGIIQNDAGDYFGSQESLLHSLKLLDDQDEKQFEYFASNYTELGNNSRSLKNYSQALQYYDLAIKYSKDSLYRLIRLNNKAATYKNEKKYDQAIHIYDTILSDSRSVPVEFARVLSNRAYVKWLRDSSYFAAPELLLALQIRKKEKDEIGLATSYRHLSDYYVKNHPDSALLYATKLDLLSRKMHSTDDRLEALSRLIPLSAGNTKKSYFNTYKLLDDSLQNARNNAKNQFALIRYETEKHKARNLVLQKQNAERQLRLISLQWISLVLLLIIVVSFLWYRKHKQQVIRKHELKTSQKVHDVVANGLYRIMTKIEHGAQVEKEVLLDDMELLYEQSRDISYETIAKPKRGFPQELAMLLKSFSSDKTSISIVGNTAHLWSKITITTQTEIMHILQELMINMKKHSGSENVVLKFYEADNRIQIRYTDDGKGFPEKKRFGNGLANTETRIKNMGGEIIFGPSVTKGLKIKIFIPIS